MSEWSIEQRETIETDELVHHARIELVSGVVDVVSTDGPTRVEVVVVDGPPVIVSLEDGLLQIRYAKPTRAVLPGFVAGLLGGRQREAQVSVAVPAATAVRLGVVDARATVAGFSAPAEVSTVSGAVVLDELGAGVKGNTVSGELQLRDVHGSVELDSVSGDLTVVAGHVDSLRADTVSGDVTLDLRSPEATTVTMNSVSGDLLLRTPIATVGRVRLSSTTGKISSADGLLTVHRAIGSVTAEGDGDGSTRVEGSTVSGRILLVDQPVGAP